MGRFAQAALCILAALAAHELAERRAGVTPGSCDGQAVEGAARSFFSQRVVTPQGVRSAVLLVEGGRFVSVTLADAAPAGALDFGSLVLSPGLVDVHTHINEPGRADWEGFESGTRAAAAGGVTTVCVQPLNSHPTTTSAETLRLKLEAAEGGLFVDAAFWGGLVPENAANTSQLGELLDAGVVGLKAFMAPSGIDDFGHVDVAQLAAALPLLRARGRLPLMVHAELPSRVEAASGTDPREYGTYLATRPRAWEEDAIRQLVGLADSFTPIHIAHLSDAGSLPLIRAAQRAGKRVTVETCPHYLTFSSADVARGDTRFKCAPPLRDPANREALLRALVGGELDLVSSDHSPSPPELKEGLDFLAAWGGIASLQLSLPATWTAARARGATLEQMAAWWSARPAELVGLAQKGAIEVGRDADFVVWDPDAPFRQPIFHQHKGHPYEGRALQGRVQATYLRGHLVYQDAAGVHRHSRLPCGKPQLR